VFDHIFKIFTVVIAIDVHSYGNEWIYPYASDATDSKLKKRDNYPLYSSVVKKLKENNRTIMSCWESLKYVADGVVKMLPFSTSTGQRIKAPCLWHTNLGAVLAMIET
jgi:hypothetical protein